MRKNLGVSGISKRCVILICYSKRYIIMTIWTHQSQLTTREKIDSEKKPQLKVLIVVRNVLSDTWQEGEPPVRKGLMHCTEQPWLDFLVPVYHKWGHHEDSQRKTSNREPNRSSYGYTKYTSLRQEKLEVEKYPPHLILIG